MSEQEIRERIAELDAAIAAAPGWGAAVGAMAGERKHLMRSLPQTGVAKPSGTPVVNPASLNGLSVDLPGFLRAVADQLEPSAPNNARLAREVADILAAPIEASDIS